MRRRSGLRLVLLLPLGVLLLWVSASVPETVERLYSRGLYPLIMQPVSSLTGRLSFSLAEALLVTGLLWLPSAIWNTWSQIRVRPSRGWSMAGRLARRLAIGASVVYFGFVMCWGINYSRLPLSAILGLDVRPSSLDELEQVSIDLIARANSLRASVSENHAGVMVIPGGASDVFARAGAGFAALAQRYPQFGGAYGMPKGVLLSRAMSYAGISGVYFPFTAEANVNREIPHSILPSTTCHEMAHQRGFAREDEANYIAYLACGAHPEQDFQYSGVFLALIHTMNALHDRDFERYQRLRATYSAGLSRDMDSNSEFWRQYEGAVERLSSNINDAYLKANRQFDGVESYGRMVDLLIAEHRAKRQTIKSR